MRCRQCSEVRRYPYKSSQLVARRPTKISADDPPHMVAGGAVASHLRSSARMTAGLAAEGNASRIGGVYDLAARHGRIMRMRILIVFSVLMTVFATSASATTCTQATANCKKTGAGKPNIEAKCEAAGVSCMRDGYFMGPVSRTPWKNLRKE
jgi:hypothetical protein